MVLYLGVAGLWAAAPEPALRLNSSDARLVAAFDWAVKQARAYVFDGDPVGPWYEAALPGRSAFCMRDVSHQAMGAHALGLDAYNYNMLHRFAENISASKDWCSYWEINKDNKPAPADYRNDEAFWYDLPANFDVLDACYRMYRWTGDRRYLDDPVLVNFYDRSVREYVDKWDLSPAHVMQRERPQPGPQARFLTSRGIPSYMEGGGFFLLGVDLLAAEYAGFRAYSQIQQLKGDVAAAEEFARKAQEIRALANGTWWNEGARTYYSIMDRDRRLQTSDRILLGGRALVYYGVAEDGEKSASALNSLERRIQQEQSSLPVEEESHYAEIFYRYGKPDVAYAQILDLSGPERKRREYPEASYSVVGAIVSGMFGIGVEEGKSVRTMPSLTAETAWAEISNLPVRGNLVTVRAEGNRSVKLVNQSGPALEWQAAFVGTYARLMVNGKAVSAKSGELPGGRKMSWAVVRVKPGGEAKAEVTASR